MVSLKQDHQCLSPQARLVLIYRPTAICIITDEGCGSPVVKLSDHGRLVMSSSLVQLKTCRVGQGYALILSRAGMSTPLVWSGS
ncbi:hypothetical protein TNCV_2423061 [Trichonephila clavipes]|nr:hypothetical protein TNCV_2423061 [Trichonephila clavipes]